MLGQPEHRVRVITPEVGGGFGSKLNIYAEEALMGWVAMKIGKPVIQRVQASGADYYASECPMARHQIESGLNDGSPPTHPLTLLRMAYGLARP